MASARSLITPFGALPLVLLYGLELGIRGPPKYGGCRALWYEEMNGNDPGRWSRFGTIVLGGSTLPGGDDGGSAK